MDWQIRIALIIGGIILVAYIFFDFHKKRKIQKENDRLKRQFSNLDNQVDGAGFDLNGVGAARAVSTESDSSNSYVATKTLQGESIDQFLSDRKEPSVEIKEVAEPQRNIETPVSMVENERIQKNNDHTSVPTSGELFEKSIPSESIKQNPQLVLSLILQAKQGQSYNGKDILPIFLSQGLRHGEMGIFHRHKMSGKNPGPVLFSLANGIAPGTFDINHINSFNSPALALFMSLPGPEDPQVAYDAMVKTIKLLKEELGGEILDETKSIYSEQTHQYRLDQIQAVIRQTV